MIINSNVKSLLPFKNLNDVYVVADFDRTITKGGSQTSWSILAGSKLVPKSYIKERQDLYDFYRPIEVSETVDINYKMAAMKDWFRKHIELFVKYKLQESIFEEAATNIRILEFRPFAKEFISFLHDNNIPLIIISAGIGNFIETFFKNNNCYFDNIYISSNKIIFKDGVAFGVDKNIVHSYNKNEVSLPNEILDKIKNRNNVVLLGDQVNDLNMVNKKDHNLVITTGFTTPDYPKDALLSNFDIVCDKDDDYKNLNNLLF